jgi:eukaryotic-like serine/threonine-protein kinase
MTDTPQTTDLHPGASLGRYELLLPIAKGGMAQVWAARLRGSRGFQKLVAVKTILTGVMDNTRMEQMFLEEAQLASQIHHPNVVGTLELGEERGQLYLVMEWVDGEPLNAVMTKAQSSGGMPLPIAVNLIAQACQGLYAAHDLRDESGALIGLVHRDVSPQNLLVTYSGTAKLVDFGIAKATSKTSGLTEAGEIKGKFAYMAPEQVRGQAIDARTDLFALGILLYLLTTGRHPFRGEHPGATVQNICADHGPTPPSAFLPDYPAALEEVVLKSLAKDPDRRFSSANEMLTALEAAMPEPLEPSYHLQVAEYLKQLFGARASERRAAIRIAQEHADRQRAESSSQISVGTLRAISVDAPLSASNPAAAVPRTLLSGAPSEVSQVPRRGRKLTGLAVGAVGLLLTLGVALQLTRGGSGGVAASSPVPAQSLPMHGEGQAPLRDTSAEGQASASAEAATAASPVPSAEEADDEVRKGNRARKVGRAPSVRGIAATPSAPAAVPAPAPVVEPPPSTPTVAPATAPAVSANAWDRGAFGGRH